MGLFTSKATTNFDCEKLFVETTDFGNISEHFSLLLRFFLLRQREASSSCLNCSPDPKHRFLPRTDMLQSRFVGVVKSYKNSILRASSENRVAFLLSL